MKALSLKQPWAELIVCGMKTVELRKWNTKFRGVFLIHASKISDENGMKLFGFENFPLGCIVGKAELVDVKKYEGNREFVRDRNLHLASGDFKGHGFVLKNVKRLKNIKCKGSLGFWEFKEDVCD
jgi:hypothetical protein